MILHANCGIFKLLVMFYTFDMFKRGTSYHLYKFQCLIYFGFHVLVVTSLSYSG